MDKYGRPPLRAITRSEKKSSDEALKVLPSIHSKITSYYHSPLPPLESASAKIRNWPPPTPLPISKNQIFVDPPPPTQGDVILE